MKDALIKYHTENPMRCTISDILPTHQQWVHTTRIFYVLSGFMDLQQRGTISSLSSGDIILVNSFEPFSIPSGSGIMIVCDLELSAVDNRFHLPPNIRFECNSTASEHKAVADVLKSLIAQFIRLNVSLTIENTFLNVSFLYSVLYHLVNYGISKNNDPAVDKSKLDRMDRISQYIHENYADPQLTLQELSKHFFLSAPYASKIIHQYFGTTFTEYLKDVRLQKAIPLLQSTDLTIDNLSASIGFSNSGSFISAFKDKFGITPGQYRKQSGFGEGAPKDAVVIDSHDFIFNNNFDILSQYLEHGNTSGMTVLRPEDIISIDPIDARVQGSPLSHFWKQVISIDNIEDLLLPDHQAVLSRIQEEIGFRHLAFRIPLGASNIFCHQTNSGEWLADYRYLDVIFDFLQSIHLRPFLIFDCTNSGCDVQSVCCLTAALFQHLQLRYGSEEISHWKASVQADFFDSGTADETEYFSLFHSVRNTIKSLNSNIAFGAPPISGGSCDPNQFFSLCAQYGYQPDFFQYHFFSYQNTPHNTVACVRQELDEYIEKNVDSIGGEAKRIPVYITKWNIVADQQEPLVDTAYQATYIAKNILENYDAVSALCYSSIFDNNSFSKSEIGPFTGGPGLFTANAIPKAAYNVLKLLSRLGSRKMASGNGYFVTRESQSIQILLYNYQLVSPLYRVSGSIDANPVNRYSPFPMQSEKEISVTLNNLEHTEYLIRETFISPTVGSSYDHWLQMGGLPLETKEEFQHLASVSCPAIQKSHIRADQNALSLIRTLAPHEVRLIELWPNLV